MTTRVRGSVASLATLAALALSGCSAAEDKAKEVAGDAACAAAGKAVDGVQSVVDGALDQIGTNPEAAKSQLTKVRDSVKAVEDRIDGGAKDKLADVRSALDELVTEAGDAVEGQVDTSAIDSSKKNLSEAIDGVSNAC